MLILGVEKAKELFDGCADYWRRRVPDESARWPCSLHPLEVMRQAMVKPELMNFKVDKAVYIVGHGVALINFNWYRSKPDYMIVSTKDQFDSVRVITN